MKIDNAKLSIEYVAQLGNKWVTLGATLDDTDDPIKSLNRLKETIECWAKGEAVMAPAPSTELPVINKAEERLAILIENAETKEELMKYKDNLTSQYLADAFSSKLFKFKLKEQEKAPY